jgi:hypothetical protein
MAAGGQHRRNQAAGRHPDKAFQNMPSLRRVKN